MTLAATPATDVRPAADVAWVDGMRCGGCALRLEDRLNALDEVDRADVSYATGRVSLWWRGRARRELLDRALADEGLARRSEDDPGADADHATRAAVGVALAMVAAAPVWAQRLVEGAPAPLDRLALPAALALVLLAVRPVMVPGLRQWWRRRPGMDALIVLGALTSYGAALTALLVGAPLETLDAGAMLLALRLVGLAIEHRARDVGARALRGALSQRTSVHRDGIATAPTALRPGDIIEVGAGDLLPVDARLLGKLAASDAGDEAAIDLDESAITGEPAPRTLAARASVQAGVRLLHGARFVVERTFADGRLGRLAEDVVAAASSRPAVQRRADRVARWLVTAMVVLAPAAGLLHVAAGGSLHEAGLRALAVLVVTCPCALALATPLVVLFATSSAARRGLVVRDADVFERAAALTHVVFDKTGTLTDASLTLDRLVTLGGWRREEVMRLAVPLARRSLHPVAQVLARGFPGDQKAAQVLERAGLGLEGLVDGHRVRIGRRTWAMERMTAESTAAESMAAKSMAAESTNAARRGAASGAEDELVGATVIAVDGQPVAAFTVSSAVIAGAAATARALRERGLSLSIASGDDERAVQAVADALVDVQTATGGLLPRDKATHVKALQGRGEHVAFVGDGLNDAAALAAADVGVAARGLLEATAPLADVRLLDAGPSALPALIDLGRHAARRMRLNLAWAAGYNLLAVPAAALGLVGPSAAAVAMVLSSLSVVVVAARFETSLSRRTPPLSATVEAPGVGGRAAVAC